MLLNIHITSSAQFRQHKVDLEAWRVEPTSDGVRKPIPSPSFETCQVDGVSVESWNGGEDGHECHVQGVFVKVSVTDEQIGIIELCFEDPEWAAFKAYVDGVVASRIKA